MEANDHLPLWDFFGLGHPAPVVGARFVSHALPEDGSDKPPGVSKSDKPKEMRCVFWSEFRRAYYVRVRHQGRRLQRGMFATAEEARAQRDELERLMGKVV